MNVKLLGASLTAAFLLAACGNTQPPKDTTPPEIRLVTENNQTVGAGSITLQGTIKDNAQIKSATYTLNGGAEQPITLGNGGAFTVEVKGLQAGENKVLLKVVDAAGNPQTFQFTVTYNPSLNDKTAPTITLTTADQQTVTQNQLQVTGTVVDDVKLKTVTLSVNGGPAQPVEVAASGAFSVLAAGFKAGTNTIEIRATDEAGNPRTQTLTVQYDDNGVGSVQVPGAVVTSNGGAAVSGTLVTVDGLPDIQTFTDSKGQFSLDLDPGSYNINFEKSGHAASRVEGLVVTTSGAAVPLNVIQKVSVHNLVAKAPEVTAVQTLIGKDLVDLTPGMELDADAGASLRIKVKAGDESLSPELIYVNVGERNGDMDYGALLFSNDPKNTEFDSTLFGLEPYNYNGIRGDTFLNITAYDFNGNRIQKFLPIHVAAEPHTSPLGAGPQLDVSATTMSTKFNMNIAGGSRPSAAPSDDSTMWVTLRWKYDNALLDNPLGFRIWRSFDNKVFKPILTVDGGDRVAIDTDPALEADKTAHYYVEAFNSTTNSRGKVDSVTPLPAFNIIAVGPANHSTNVSVQPTLTWTVDRLVGDVREFYPSIWNYPEQNGSSGDECVWGRALCEYFPDYLYADDGTTPGLKKTGNTYSLIYNENKKALYPRLESYHSYTFALSAAAYNSDGSAVSIAQDMLNVFSQFGHCNFGGPVCEGNLSLFMTGDGSF
ncbi:carboxypeptidase regulatory-like domain-containing protein [Deinococcus cellulosilyticus]|uniref:Uncharacterized protein n=1 Tax=Deinococcus cellulosilyticus (strain DSM 18568 / NBRC 106333 / KACC 11606 / 5516J-15) TaxID=1223518 RepID=A0A511N480_DEIC1|nr:carboxypeptidase regulatory-like domain-containing protein [Deinococcus cellulosilyticus]GEM47680.1 hypothetical protein DC3_33150 [Deinococcus cellulosilyticus NBRC 106333 = KACC 11606]